MNPILKPTKALRLTLVEFLVVLAIIGILVVLLLPAVQQGTSNPSREQCRNNLKQIGLALHEYHEEYGSFPPAFIADENGRPIHSWRVFLLPFLGEKPLYDEYRFDEPWDGPNNSSLADRAVEVYQCPTSNRRNGRTSITQTSYVAVVGPESVWPESKSRALGEITDPAAETLQVVEIQDSGIHWMEPRDLTVSQVVEKARDGLRISSDHPGGAQVLFVDGHVRFLQESLSESTLKGLLTIAGGEQVDLE